jgi:hypothetical protein
MKHLINGLAILMLFAAATATAASVADVVKLSSFDVQFRVVESCLIEQSEARIEARCSSGFPPLIRSNYDTSANVSSDERYAPRVLVYF